jgi:hypothetical protein
MKLDYELESELSIRKIKNELFIFDRKSGRVHTFNSIGAFIWQLIEQKTPYSEIISTITEQFEVSIEMLQLDIVEFFHQLENKQLIKIMDLK